MITPVRLIAATQRRGSCPSPDTCDSYGCRGECREAVQRRKPTLLEVINARRDLTMIRLAKASNITVPHLQAVMRENVTTPRIATQIAIGLTALTGHHFSVMDIELAVHP